MDPESQTIEVSLPGSLSQVYGAGENVPVVVLPGVMLSAAALFEA